jgi:hypothetical protein
VYGVVLLCFVMETAWVFVHGIPETGHSDQTQIRLQYMGGVFHCKFVLSFLDVFYCHKRMFPV